MILFCLVTRHLMIYRILITNQADLGYPWFEVVMLFGSRLTSGVEAVEKVLNA